jgi:EAL domain-containing protein (putative c-di-GMP-specific phosphodiesterase class I)/ActR/RegA family two-component response regulator
MTMPMHATVRFPSLTHKGAILLIEDDALLARSLVRLIRAEGYEVVHVDSAAGAIDLVKSGSFDAVVSDLNLPGASGVDVLNLVRAYDPDVPLVLMTGAPTVDTAIEACNLGVLEYLVKPTPCDQLARVLDRATKARRAAIHQREANDAASRAAARQEAPTVRPTIDVAAVTTLPAPAPGTMMPVETLAILNVPAQKPRDVASAVFDRAMASLAVDLEPIADAKSKTLVGFAARMRSDEDTLATDLALVVMATQLERLQELRQRARDLAVRTFASAPPEALLFVDVHPSDLLDGDLYSPEPPLARIAERVVLQVHARGIAIADLGARASVLRFVGFRLAIADLDVGQACLGQIAELAPEFVKIDSRLVKGLEGSLGRRRLVSALVSMCRSLDATPVAEGVTTAEEREALLASGCDLVQGSIAARHIPAGTHRRAPGSPSDDRCDSLSESP